ncbi:ABC transporter permease [Bacillus suaedae]|uniref:ABC transporter permease n=1 Tax=Halalkalibacter suaedae TaxID=2822140 RepID=A0A940X0A7_9BACI|nr:ABC transporter permease subunit [Bacillus suaedae]MBP3952476.1 ABC transporter permease [Bacillus suaedae]
MLRNIYFKEMKDSFRDRRTLLLTVFLPIIMMTGLTLFYENMLSDGDGERYTLAVQESFGTEEEKIFSSDETIEYIKSQDPQATVENGEAQAALITDEDFITQIENGEKTSVVIIGDSFSQNSSYLMSVVTNALAVYEQSIITERLQAEGANLELIQPFSISQKEVSEEDPSINLIAMLIPLVLAIAIGVGAAPSASDLFAGEKEKKTMEALLMTPVNRSTLLVAKWLTITSIGAITGIITLIVVALEITFLTENLKQAVTFNNQAALIIGCAVLASIVYAALMSSLLMLTSIIGKTVKEAQSYSSPIMMLSMFPVMILTSYGVNELTFTHFAIPVMNLFSILKELSFGIIDYQHLMVMLGSNLLAIIIIFIAGRILFMKDKWVMN